LSRLCNIFDLIALFYMDLSVLDADCSVFAEDSIEYKVHLFSSVSLTVSKLNSTCMLPLCMRHAKISPSLVQRPNTLKLLLFIQQECVGEPVPVEEPTAESAAEPPSPPEQSDEATAQAEASAEADVS